jgi:hypothetical protein
MHKFRWTSTQFYSPRLASILRLLDLSLLASLASLVLYTVSKHESWSDEAQAWLIARDMPYARMIFSELRYEGHPVLWYTVLWPLIHWFTVPYQYLGYIGATFAISGLAVLIFLAPFPRLARYLVASSFFLIYQYSVVARSYNLLPLLGFLAAYFFREGLPRAILFALTVALLIQISVHGALLGIVLCGFYGLRYLWPFNQVEQQYRVYAIVAAVIVVLSLALFVVVVYPPADVEGIADAAELSLSSRLIKTIGSLIFAFSNFLPVSCGFLFVSYIWVLLRGGRLLMLPSVLGTAALFGFLRGAPQHMGLVVVAFLVSTWVLWPSPRELHDLSSRQRVVHVIFVASLVGIFGLQTAWAYRAMRNDWYGPYSGAQPAAAFLKSVSADRQGCSAFLYGEVAVAPYFDHNIFENLGGWNAPSYFHHSVGQEQKINRLPGTNLTSRFVLVSVAHQEWIGPLILGMGTNRYVLVFRADGWRFFENNAGVQQAYLVFQRTEDH